jgi:hypothetical protein
MTNKNFFVLTLCFLFVSLILIGSVSAVGIKWYTESEIATEGEEVCIRYGAYNPSNQDILVNVEVTGSLQNVVIGPASEETLVLANTHSSVAKDINFCFTVPYVYEPDCLVGNMVCEQVCEGDRLSFDGEIIMTEKPADTAGDAAAGSGISLSASAPLSLEVACNPYPRNYTPVYIVGIVVVAILLGVAIYNKNKKSKKRR